MFIPLCVTIPRVQFCLHGWHGMARRVSLSPIQAFWSGLLNRRAQSVISHYTRLISMVFRCVSCLLGLLIPPQTQESFLLSLCFFSGRERGKMGGGVHTLRYTRPSKGQDSTAETDRQMAFPFCKKALAREAL